MILTEITGIIDTFPAAEESTVVVRIHVDHIVITCMIKNDIHNDTDPVLMSCINKCLEFLSCTICSIRLGIVCYIISMI